MKYYKIEDHRERLTHPYHCKPEEMKYVYRSRESAIENAKNIFEKMIENKDESWFSFIPPGLVHNLDLESRPNWESVEIKCEGNVVEISGVIQHRLLRTDTVNERIDLENGAYEIVQKKKVSVVKDWTDYCVHGIDSPSECSYRLYVEEGDLHFWEEKE